MDGAVESEDDFEFRVGGRLFVWAWRERVDPKKPKVPSSNVVVVAVRDEMDKRTLLGDGNGQIFTEPHYDGWPDVLVRLPEIDDALLEKLIVDSYELAVTKGPPKSRRRGFRT
jgi:hypothetical protein